MPPHDGPLNQPVVDTEPSHTPSKLSFPSLSEIKSKLPKDCFTAELPTSIYYVVRSAVLTISLWFLAYTLLSPESNFYISNEWIRAICWGLYWNLQGVLMWGIFVLGHDCGHGSFSKYPWVNHIFGNILHSSILVPYESWKVTHRLHHKNTGNIDKDEIFYPYREDTTLNWSKRFLVASYGFAWFIYIYVNTRRHFWVFESIYDRQRISVVLTLLWWSAMASLVSRWVFIYGLETVGYYYFAPLFVFMSWLVVTTFLHHQDEDAPWYGNQEWTYVKGNLSSIDRSYGFIVDNLIHSIGTHQVHHLFPKIPHYKLDRATKAFREAYPEFVRVSDESITISFLKNYWNYLNYGTACNGEQFFKYRDAKIAAKKLN